MRVEIVYPNHHTYRPTQPSPSRSNLPVIPFDLAADRRAVLDLRGLPAGDVAVDLRARTDDDVAVERDDVVTHGPGDLDVAVEDHHALGRGALDRRVAVEDHGRPDRGAVGDEQLARQHDLIVRTRRRALVLRERRGRDHDPHRAGGEHHDRGTSCVSFVLRPRACVAPPNGRSCGPDLP